MELAAATVMTVIYGIAWGHHDEPAVAYRTEAEARNVLVSLGLPGVIVRKSILETDWEVVL